MGKFLSLLAGLLLATNLWAGKPNMSYGPTNAAKSNQPLTAPQTAGQPKPIAWTAVDSISPAASRLTAAACNGKVYRFSGNTASTSTDTIEEFDPALGYWVAKNTLPYGIYNSASAVWKGKIFVLGFSYVGGVGMLSDSIMVYHSDGDSVQVVDNIGFSLAAPAMAVVEDTLYVIGGTVDFNNGLTSVYACELNTMTWTVKSPLVSATSYAAAAVYNGIVYVFGGRSGGVDLTAVQRYDPKADTTGGTPWSLMTSLGTARGGLGAATIADKVYIFGGGWSTYLNTVDVYSPAGDTIGGTPWTSETSFGTGRRTIGAAALGNKAYVIGGWNGSFRNNVEEGMTGEPVYNDAAVERIEIPQFLGNYGVNVPPYVTVSNLSPIKQYDIPVTLTIDSSGSEVYRQTVYTTLDSGATGFAIFPSWSASTNAGVVYNLQAWMSWSLDQNQTNDTIASNSEIVNAIWYQDDPSLLDGHAAQNFEVGYDAYDCWLFEDFWISGPDSLWLDSVYVRGMYASYPGPLDSIQFTIMPDSAGAPGYPAFSQPFWSGYFAPSSYTESSGSFMVRFPQQVKLYGNNPGWWIAFQGQMNYDVGGQWYMAANTYNVRGSYEGFWYNPGGGFGKGTGYIHDSDVWTGTTDHSFILYGSLTPNTGVAGQPDRTVSPKFSLRPAWPNPAVGSASISYSLPKSGYSKLAVYSVSGQLVRTLVNGNQAAGVHNISWDGKDQGGRRVSSGVYIYKLEAGSDKVSGKLIMLK